MDEIKCKVDIRKMEIMKFGRKLVALGQQVISALVFGGIGSYGTTADAAIHNIAAGTAASFRLSRSAAQPIPSPICIWSMRWMEPINRLCVDLVRWLRRATIIPLDEASVNGKVRHIVHVDINSLVVEEISYLTPTTAESLQARPSTIWHWTDGL